MMMKKSKGFTIVELVVTLGILGLSTALVVAIIANLARIQNASSDQFVFSDELQKIDNIVNDYVSFVSLNNDEVSFTYKSSNDTSLVFKYDTYDFTLTYLNNTISISSNYDGAEDYFKKSRSENIKNVTDFKFTYVSEYNLLNLKVTINEKVNHMDYIVRTNR